MCIEQQIQFLAEIKAAAESVFVDNVGIDRNGEGDKNRED
jgi:hypothetical protein